MDTVFLMLRKHEVIFLHSYHHVITLWLTWFMMDLSAPPQAWLPASLARAPASLRPMSATNPPRASGAASR